MAMEPPAVAEMHFLFQKVDASIFEPSFLESSSLAEICLQKTLNESDSHNTHANLLVSATLKRILTLHRDFSQPISSEIAEKVVEYVFKKWDSSVDVICYEAVDSFGLLLDIHKPFCLACKKMETCSFRYNLVQNLFSSPSTCRSIFKCINLLANCYPGLDLINDNFVEQLYQNIGSPSLVAVISETICSNVSSPKCNSHLHLDHIEKSMLSPSENLRSAVMDRLIPNLVKKGHSGLISRLLERLEDSERQYTTRQQEAVLSIVGMLIKANGVKIWSDFVEKETLSKALLHCSSQVRLTAWTLLCTHPRISTPFTSTDLDLMRLYLLTSASEQSPAIRQKMLVAFKQVLIRMAETGEQAIKKGEMMMMKTYDRFLDDVLNQAFGSLSAEANFNRRILSLSLIDFVYRQNYMRPSGKSAFYTYFSANHPLTKIQFRHLLRCLDDSFQLCQSMSSDLLKAFDQISFDDSDSFLAETKKIMSSIRSHNSLTASYRLQFFIHRNPEKLTEILKEFLAECEIRLEVAEKVMMTITESPIHPILSALFSLLPRESQFLRENKDFWPNFVKKKLIPFCYRMAALVTPVVHSMAPEGYIPEKELQELTCDGASSSLQDNRSQLLLVCCWRAHKHISEIFDWTVRTCYPDLISASDVQKIGEYFWLQLTECRHCGAFESAVDGFTYLCSFLWKRTETGLPSPINWLRRILKALEGGEDLDNLCSTRRSAGVPHLVAAILSTEHGETLEGLKLAAASLLNLGKWELKYRIHSLNVLKAIVHSSALRERIVFLLEPACRLAVAGCSAQSWSERNSSAQLAAALRTHIFGVTRSSQRDLHVDSKNRQSAHEFFSRFPSLYPFLYHQLENVEEEFSAYPTLIFLTHLYATNTKTNYRLGPFIPLCLKTLLWCKAEKLRRLCAVAAVAICQEEDLEIILDWLSKAEPRKMTQNHINSALLLLQAIFTSKPEFKIRIETIVAGFGEFCCEFNRNLVQEVCNQLAGKDGYFSNFAAVAIAQKEILSRKSFSPLTAATELVRREIYGWLCERDQLEITSGLNELIETATSDYKRELGQQAAFMPKKVLDKYCGQMTDACLLDSLKKELEDHRLLPESIAVSYSLLSKSQSVDCYSVIYWAKSTIDLEEDYPKLKAIEICTESYEKTQNKGFLKVLLEMLQDEDQVIRGVVSESVSSRILFKDYPLNPEVCRHLLIEKIGQTEVFFTRETAVTDDSLFDACAVNVFAEPRLFGDFNIVENLL